MKDQAVQQRFVLLRAQGWAFRRIAKELGISHGTVVNWSRKFRFEIQNLRAIELEALRDELISTADARARLLSNQLRKVQVELTKRDLTQVSTSRLFGIEASLRRQILEETGQMSFTSPVKDIPEEEYTEHVQDWQP